MLAVKRLPAVGKLTNQVRLNGLARLFCRCCARKLVLQHQPPGRLQYFLGFHQAASREKPKGRAEFIIWVAALRLDSRHHHVADASPGCRISPLLMA